MAFGFGAMMGHAHPPLLEQRQSFLQILKIYAAIFAVGVLAYAGAALFCEMGNCNAHHGLVSTYVSSGFLMGLGGTGFIINLAQLRAGNAPSGNNDMTLPEYDALEIQNPMV